jgi:hypothetical protein
LLITMLWPCLSLQTQVCPLRNYNEENANHQSVKICSNFRSLALSFVLGLTHGKLTQRRQGVRMVARSNGGLPPVTDFELRLGRHKVEGEPGRMLPTEAQLRRRGRRQGLALMMVSAMISVLALYGAWALIAGR